MRLLEVLLAAALLIGGAALVGCYTFLPSLLEGMVAGNLQRSMGLASEPGVKLASDPPPRMLAGEFSRGEIEMKGADLGGVRPDRITVDLDPFDVEVLKSAASGSLKVREPLTGKMRVELTEQQVSEIARERVEDFPIEGVSLSRDRAVVSSKVEILGFPVPVSVDGEVSARGGALVFEPREVRALGVPVPKRLTDALLAGTDFTYRIEGLPYDTEIKDVRVEEGRAILTGYVRGITLGDSGG
ncbi:MAG TPA: DUF2993 domain-containing protein [Rubrobacteraceae bacterium]|nr:DUF2993 domain-containing protein [Rubrobacteraceae bacterium]